MHKLLTFLLGVFLFTNALPQSDEITPQTKIMTLGVFHFAYPNLDAIQTKKKNQISVLNEPYQSEIIAIANAVSEFRPTIIAIEVTPDQQGKIDSLYALYRADQFTLRKGEVYQLGFRIGKISNVPIIHCVNHWGRHYKSIEALFKDSIRQSKFVEYFRNSPDSIYEPHRAPTKVKNIIDELKKLNDPAAIRERLSVYLLNPFKYEEKPGDFTGVDFETGRWFNRNLRIFRNIQRIQHSSDDRILLIIGREHLNLLNLFFDVSKEFELVSPLPYLEKASPDN
ncbi:DUF5694 domain-containing protein [Prolixibacter denitrificans]|uniref:TraB/GumN family protein n=1 Tax=Prolixibacter denitrificans TaxID=1541063 RepID=A0A2P8CE61_9BACT|nr:DUF5694 domain-containing protein [Prolixibacter denitrificans]PSK83263.1 hypothetical protein CLV93_104193 [Prolixibacter denitrificans]GET21854.1 hypothetical protein JCM18694_21000 [Prolixibacter denitrificans]